MNNTDSKKKQKQKSSKTNNNSNSSTTINGSFNQVPSNSYQDSKIPKTSRRRRSSTHIPTFNSHTLVSQDIFSPLQRPSKPSPNLPTLLKDSVMSAILNIWNRFKNPQDIIISDKEQPSVLWDYTIVLKTSQDTTNESSFIKSFIEFCYTSAPFASRLAFFIPPPETLKLSPLKIQQLYSYFLALLVSKYGLIVRQTAAGPGKTMFYISAPFTVLAVTAQKIGLEKIKKDGSIVPFSIKHRWSFSGYSNPHTFWTVGERALLVQHIIKNALPVPIPQVCPSIELVGLDGSSAVSGFSQTANDYSLLSSPFRQLDLEFFKFYRASSHLHVQGHNVLSIEDAVFRQIFDTINSFATTPKTSSTLQLSSNQQHEFSPTCSDSKNLSISSSFRIDLLNNPGGNVNSSSKKQPYRVSSPEEPSIPSSNRTSNSNIHGTKHTVKTSTHTKHSSLMGSINKSGPLSRLSHNKISSENHSTLRHTSSDSSIRQPLRLDERSSPPAKSHTSSFDSPTSHSLDLGNFGFKDYQNVDDTDIIHDSSPEVASKTISKSTGNISPTLKVGDSTQLNHLDETSDTFPTNSISPTDPKQQTSTKSLSQSEIKDAFDLLAPPSILVRINSLPHKEISYPRHPVTGKTWEFPHSGSLVSLKRSMNPPIPIKYDSSSDSNSSTSSVFSQFETWDLIDSYYPVHHPVARKQLWASWKSFNFQRHYRYSLQHVKILDSCQQYLGPDLCFYFTFLFEFTSSLFIPGLLSILFFFLGVGTPPSSSSAAYTSLIFALFILLWSFHIIYIARKSHSLSKSLCASQFTQSYVHKWYDSLTLIQNLNTQFQFQLRQLFSIFFTLLLCASSVFCYLFYINFYHSVTLWEKHTQMNSLFSLISLNLPILLYTLFVFRLASLSKPWLRSLNDWETSNLEIPALTKHNSLIYKRFLFELVNSYVAPYHLLFIQGNIPEFRAHLFYFFFTKPLISFFVEFILPTIKKQYYMNSQSDALDAIDTPTPLDEKRKKRKFATIGKSNYLGNNFSDSDAKESENLDSNNSPEKSGSDSVPLPRESKGESSNSSGPSPTLFRKRISKVVDSSSDNDRGDVRPQTARPHQNANRSFDFSNTSRSEDPVDTHPTSNNTPKMSNQKKNIQRTRRNSLTSIKDIKISKSGITAKQIQNQVLNSNEDFSILRQRIKQKHNTKTIKLKKKKPITDVPKSNSSHQINDSSFDPFLGSYDDYLEIILPFGFCLSFGSIYPLCIVSCFLNNLFESRTDLYKFLFVYTRPQFSPPGTAWIHILVLLQYIGILTQTAIFTMTPWKAAISQSVFTDSHFLLFQNLFFLILVLIYNFPIRVPTHIQKKLPTTPTILADMNTTSSTTLSEIESQHKLYSSLPQTWPLRTALIFGLRTLATRVRLSDIKDWSTRIMKQPIPVIPINTLPSSPIKLHPIEPVIPVQENKSSFGFFKRSFSAHGSSTSTTSSSSVNLSSEKHPPSFPVSLKKLSFLKPTNDKSEKDRSILVDNNPQSSRASPEHLTEKKSFLSGSKKLMSQTTSVLSSMGSAFKPRSSKTPRVNSSSSMDISISQPFQNSGSLSISDNIDNSRSKTPPIINNNISQEEYLTNSTGSSQAQNTSPSRRLSQ